MRRFSIIRKMWLATRFARHLADFGFRVEERPPLVPDVPAKDIVFGDRIPPENAKLVAYVLIRVGVDIRGIHRPRLAPKSAVIQVIGNRIVADGPRFLSTTSKNCPPSTLIQISR